MFLPIPRQKLAAISLIQGRTAPGCDQLGPLATQSSTRYHPPRLIYTELRDWLNDELTKLGEEKFFHKDFDSTLKPAYGDSVQADDVVVEGGKI